MTSPKNLVIIIDEYPALVTNCGDRALLKDTTQTLLQRGRHVKMFTIITAQNPTKEILGNLDLGSVDARMAFHCPKDFNSRTILGEDGAENLHEKGLALVKLPGNGGVIQKLKGSLIEPKDVPAFLDDIRAKHEYADYSYVVNEPLLLQSDNESSPVVIFSSATVGSQEEVDDKLLVDIVMWTLERSNVSGNAINTEFGVGERGEQKLIDKLYKMGIVGTKDGKKARKVIPQKIEDLTDDAITFLEYHDYTKDGIENAFNNKE